jgi:two-component system sensor histidine kinase UhpB
MDISRYLARRIFLISSAILVIALALAVWRAQFDVKGEELGALDVVRLFETVNALESGPPESVEQNLETLRRINASNRLRNLRFELRDSSGHVLVAPNAGEPLSALEKAFAWLVPGIRSAAARISGFWPLQRDGAARFIATLSINPASEQKESFDNVLGVLIVLVGYAGAMLLAVQWMVKRALTPLRSIFTAIDRYEHNDFSHRLAPLRFAEVAAIGRALNHMAATLAQAQEQRRALSLKLVSLQEDERARIARDLHDEFGQTLTAMRADVRWLTHKAAGREELVEVLRGMEDHCVRLHQSMRDLLSRLQIHDSHVAGIGVPLHKLLADLVRSWNDRPSHSMQFRLNYGVSDEAAVPDEVALTIYRLTQEALTNSVKHAAARHVTVTLHDDSNGELSWSVEDDGIGIDSLDARMQFGNGLAGMHERAWAVGSDVDIRSPNPGADRRGLRVSARFNLVTAAGAQA